MRVFVIWFLVSIPISVFIGVFASLANHQRKRDTRSAYVRVVVDLLDADAPWARRLDDGWSITIQVQPGATRSEVVGPHGDALRIRVAGAAVDGKANAELVRFLAEHLGVPRRDVEIVRGHTARRKVVRVTA